MAVISGHEYVGSTTLFKPVMQWTPAVFSCESLTHALSTPFQLLLEMVGSNDPDLQEAAAGCLANIRHLAVENTKTAKKTRTASKASN